jgi:hypothetical protein
VRIAVDTRVAGHLLSGGHGAPRDRARRRRGRTAAAGEISRSRRGGAVDGEGAGKLMRPPSTESRVRSPNLEDSHLAISVVGVVDDRGIERERVNELEDPITFRAR